MIEFIKENEIIAYDNEVEEGRELVVTSFKGTRSGVKDQYIGVCLDSRDYDGDLSTGEWLSIGEAKALVDALQAMIKRVEKK